MRGGPLFRAALRVWLGSGEVVFRSGLLLANDPTAPGVHLLAKANGSSIRVVAKDGRERLITP